MTWFVEWHDETWPATIGVRPTETDVERVSWLITVEGLVTDYPKDDNGVSYPDNRPTPAHDGGKPEEPPAEPNPDGGDEGDRKDDD